MKNSAPDITILAQIVARKGGTTLGALLTEGKKEIPTLTRGDIITESEDSVALNPALEELLDFKPFVFPVTEEEQALIDAGQAKIKIRYFFVPKGTQFLDDEDDGDDGDSDGGIELDESAISTYFAVDNTKGTVTNHESVAAAVGAQQAIAAAGGSGQVFAGVAVDVSYSITVAMPRPAGAPMAADSDEDSDEDSDSDSEDEGSEG